MGCHKLTYQNQETTSPFMGIWKAGAKEKNSFFSGGTLAKKGQPLKKRDYYYPFGLSISALSSTAPLSMPNKYNTFQGQERVEDFDLNWIQFKWRNHDPQIARFFNVDPLADEFVYNSPYAFSENQVINAVELEGLEKVQIINYSKVQPEKMKKNLDAKKNVMREPVTTTNSRKKHLENIDKFNSEVDRIVSYGKENGFPDNHMVNQLEEAGGIVIPGDVAKGETTINEMVLDPEAKPQTLFFGVMENSDGKLELQYLGQTDKAKEKKTVNNETKRAVGKTLISTIIDLLIGRTLPFEMPPIMEPPVNKRPDKTNKGSNN